MEQREALWLHRFDEVADGKKWLCTKNTYIICTLFLTRTHKCTLHTCLQSPPPPPPPPPGLHLLFSSAAYLRIFLRP